MLVAAAVTLAAVTATSSSHAASVRQSSAKDGSRRLLDEWAACARSHGFQQANPTAEHQVIHIAVAPRSLRGGEIRLGDPNLPATCRPSLAAAQRAVAGGRPVKGWGDNTAYVRYANCMRANGYPSFPYPSGRIEPDGNESTDFNGTGIDPLSPAFLNGHANQMCGRQIGAPAWWINSWGPPGSVDVYPAGANPNGPLPTGPRPTPLVPGACGASKGMGPSARG